MTRLPILEQVAALADGTRSRILLLLEQSELTVSELCATLQLPQSTVSRHLKLLADQRWVVPRREGTSRFYSLGLAVAGPAAESVWGLVREQVSAGPGAQQDAERLASVLAERRRKSQQFFSTTAGQWDGLRQELFGRRFDLAGLLGFVDEDWVVGDLGCGTGQVSEDLSPFVRRVVAVDSSTAMLKAARERLGTLANVDLRRGELEALPIQDGELDGATLFCVLHHTAEPKRVIGEAARALRPGGRLLIVDMMPHDRDSYQQQMGHVWLGFSSEFVQRQLRRAGFDRVQFQPLPADPEAKGPNLFLARGRRPLRRGAGEVEAAKKSQPLESDTVTV